MFNVVLLVFLPNALWILNIHIFLLQSCFDLGIQRIYRLFPLIPSQYSNSIFPIEQAFEDLLYLLMKERAT